MGGSSLRIPRFIWLDSLILCGIAVFLGILHYSVPDAARVQFIFIYGEPTLVTAWTSAFFHDSTAHLRSNLMWYAAIIALIYILYFDWEQRRMFWLTSGTIILVTPAITTLFDYWLLHQRWGLTADTATAQGFSGVVCAFGGMLFITLGVIVADRTNRLTGLKSLLAVAFVSATGLAITAGSLTPRMVLLLFIGGAGTIALFVSWDDIQHPRLLWARLHSYRVELEIVVLGGLAFVMLFVSMFPVSEVADGRFVNVLAHGVGLMTGMVVTTVIATERRLC